MKKSYAELERENRELKKEIAYLNAVCVWFISESTPEILNKFCKPKKPAAKVFKEKSN